MSPAEEDEPPPPCLRYARCQWSDNKHYRRCSAKKRLAEDYLAIWHWENSLSHVINTNRRMSRCCCAHQQRGDARPLEGETYWLMTFRQRRTNRRTFSFFSVCFVRQSCVDITNRRLFLYWFIHDRVTHHFSLCLTKLTSLTTKSKIKKKQLEILQPSRHPEVYILFLFP